VTTTAGRPLYLRTSRRGHDTFTDRSGGATARVTTVRAAGTNDGLGEEKLEDSDDDSGARPTMTDTSASEEGGKDLHIPKLAAPGVVSDLRGKRRGPLARSGPSFQIALGGGAERCALSC
jgi:hypothetical protein